MSTSPPVYELTDVRRAVDHGRVIVVGVLNTAHDVLIDGRRLFVRERTLEHAGDYGQTFAGERHVPQAVCESVLIPKLLTVVCDEAAAERYAVFEFVEGHEPVWDDEAFASLATYLAVTHQVRGHIPGPVGTTRAVARPEDHSGSDLRRFVVGLFETEFERLPGPSQTGMVGRARRVLENLPAYRSDDLCLCHGDVRSANFLRDELGAIWMLDWEAARYRVPASDFNQIRNEWLTTEQSTTLIDEYCARTSREATAFRFEVDMFRLLWHVRTFNFEQLILRSDPKVSMHHLGPVEEILTKYE